MHFLRVQGHVGKSVFNSWVSVVKAGGLVVNPLGCSTRTFFIACYYSADGGAPKSGLTLK